MRRRNGVLVGVLAVFLAFSLGRISAGVAVSHAAHTGAASTYARFAGNWYHHSSGLTLTQDGHGVEHFRTYVDCTANRLTACDRWIGNTIYGGGFVAFYLWKVKGPSVIGSVTASAYSWQIGTQVTITPRANPNIMDVRFVGRSYPACRGTAITTGACGA